MKFWAWTIGKKPMVVWEISLIHFEKKKIQKNFQKSIDKRRSIVYNRWARFGKRVEIALWKLNNMKFRALKSAEISLKHFEKSTSNKEAKINSSEKGISSREWENIQFFREFDPGSGLTLAACITHSSRTERWASVYRLVADGWVTREQSTFQYGITTGNSC